MTNKSQSDRESVYDIVTAQIIEQLEAGCVPWRKAWTSDAPRNWKGRPYRGINVWLLAMAPYSDPRWLTFKQARALGGSVKKGERSRVVVFWKCLHDKSDRTASEVQSGSEERRPRFVLRYYRVFNLEQTEGVDLGQMASATENPVPNRSAEAILAQWEGAPDVRRAPSPVYFPAEDVIGMPSISKFDPVEEYYCALFHEMAHATGHPKRLARFDVGASHPEAYAREELVAEMTAAYLCAVAGVENTLPNSAAYLNGWIEKLRGNPRTVVVAAAQAQKAADLILGAAPAQDEALDSAEAQAA